MRFGDPFPAPKKSRTPHLDRHLARQAKRGEHHKPPRRNALPPLPVEKVSPALGRPRAGGNQTAGPHTHVCVEPQCKASYRCTHVCNPEDLKSSLCAKCFREAQYA